MTQKEVKIQTAFGEYKVEYVYQTETDYFAVTGKDFTQRTWMIDGNEYRKLKAELSS